MTWRREGDKEYASTGKKTPLEVFRKFRGECEKEAQDSAGHPNQCLAPELQDAQVPLSYCFLLKM